MQNQLTYVPCIVMCVHRQALRIVYEFIVDVDPGRLLFLAWLLVSFLQNNIPRVSTLSKQSVSVVGRQADATIPNKPPCCIADEAFVTDLRGCLLAAVRFLVFQMYLHFLHITAV